MELGLNLNLRRSMRVIRIPRVFWQDCVDCDCDVSPAIKMTKRYVWIREDVAISELISRATMYADKRNGYWESCRGLAISARATLKAIKAAA